jgi:membrane fusion protein, peptide pheromone/bacteriocin exporter
VRIIPSEDTKIKAVLTVLSEDIAEISQGMTFLLSFPKLPPSEYGYLEGTVKTIPKDVEINTGTNSVYKVDGYLESCILKKHTKEIHLMPGMEAEGRIIIKRERVIRYFLEKLDFVS